LIRLSVGIEDIDDLKADLQAVFETRIINTFNFRELSLMCEKNLSYQAALKIKKYYEHIKIFYKQFSFFRFERQKKEQYLVKNEWID
jgi:hypothetical protein